jgi:hypothetical protein
MVEARTQLDSFQAKLTIVLPHHAITFAGGLFKILAVHNRHCATSVLDDLLPLQNTSRQGHAGSVCSQHRCQKIMSDRQGPRIYSILRHQQPPRQTLLNVVQPIAGGRLGDLHSLDHGKPRRALRRVRREAVLRYNPFKIHLAHTLKQCRTMLLYVVGIAQS